MTTLLVFNDGEPLGVMTRPKCSTCGKATTQFVMTFEGGERVRCRECDEAIEAKRAAERAEGERIDAILKTRCLKCGAGDLCEQGDTLRCGCGHKQYTGIMRYLNGTPPK
jgi:DNA-directed RNA polymerase subunit RPC12/RpoP